MKRQLSLFMVCAIVTMLSAQTGIKDGWTLKPLAGLTLSTLVGDDAPDCKSKLGMAAGVETEWQGRSRLGFSAGLLYINSPVGEGDGWTGHGKVYGISEKGVPDYRHHLWGNYDYRFHFLAMPLLLRLHVGNGLSLYAGLQPQVLLAARESYTHETYEYLSPEKYGVRLSSDDESSGISDICDKFSVSVPVGLTCNYGHLSFDLRYCFGLNKVENFNDPMAPVRADSPYEWKLYRRQKDTWRCLMLSVGYKFYL